MTRVHLWDRYVGAASWDTDRTIAHFEYAEEFLSDGWDIAPLHMPRGTGIRSFPELAPRTFHGLPGLLADSLPDRFGSLLIDQWLVNQGRDPGSSTPIERLCYIGKRGMGALEFEPVLRRADPSHPIDVAALVRVAEEIVARRGEFGAVLSGKPPEDERALRDILQVGTSAGGARAKAVIAFRPETGEVRSGQVEAPEGFTHWILKFDGVGSGDGELGQPEGYGRIEYAYSRMARTAGIDMTECRLLPENERAHFLTRRFDRTDSGEKRFVQTLCALGHMDYNRPGGYSYEQALGVAERLGVPRPRMEQLFRRMVFNVLARNQDDHTKNISFLLDGDGSWDLTPAYDVMFGYNPRGDWTSKHQMTLNGKRDAFVRSDFRAAADRYRLLRGAQLDTLLEEVDAAVGTWHEEAARAGVPSRRAEAVTATHRRLATIPVA